AEVALERAEALQERRAGLVPGRAQEHGRLDLRRSLAGAHARAAEHQGQARPLRRPPGLGLDRRRPDDPPPEGTRDVPDGSLRLVFAKTLRSASPMADIMTPALGESV